MKFASWFKKFLKILNPAPPIAGLAITDSALRLLLIREGAKPATAVLRLPPGIMERGRVKDKVGLRTALKTLRSQIAPLKKPLHVILSLPPDVVYTQTFSVPLLAEERLGEAAKLNLQMISPIDFSAAYADWQKIGESFSEGVGQLELLGAFAEAAVVNELTAALKDAHFLAAAVEFPALGLARILSRDPELKSEAGYLLISAAPEGLSVAIVRNLNLYFNHFLSWATVAEEIGAKKKILPEEFKEFLFKEIQKVLNFYASRFAGYASKILFIGSGLGAEFEKAVLDNFQLKIQNLVIPGAEGLSPAWFTVFGSALRGALPRSADNFLSLTGEPVQLKYWQSRLLNFVGVWRNIAITVAAAMLAFYVGAHLLLVNEIKKLEAASGRAPREIAEAKALEQKAREFNSLVELASGAKAETAEWSKFFVKFEQLTGLEVTLRGIRVSGRDVIMDGSAVNEEAALNFKARLMDEANIADLVFPIANIKIRPDGAVDFHLNFRFKTLEF